MPSPGTVVALIARMRSFESSLLPRQLDATGNCSGDGEVRTTCDECHSHGAESVRLVGVGQGNASENNKDYPDDTVNGSNGRLVGAFVWLMQQVSARDQISRPRLACDLPDVRSSAVADARRGSNHQPWTSSGQPTTRQPPSARASTGRTGRTTLKTVGSSPTFLGPRRSARSSTEQERVALVAPSSSRWSRQPIVVHKAECVALIGKPTRLRQSGLRGRVSSPASRL